MQVSISNDGLVARVTEDVVAADDVLEMCLRCMLAVGYHPDSVADAVAEWALLDGAIDCTRDQ